MNQTHIHLTMALGPWAPGLRNAQGERCDTMLCHPGRQRFGSGVREWVPLWGSRAGQSLYRRWGCGSKLCDTCDSQLLFPSYVFFELLIVELIYDY